MFGIHFFGYSDRNEIPVSQGMKKEVDNKENSVRIVQEVDAISASLYSGAAKVKELLFRFYGKEKNCVLMTARVTVHGEIMYGYTFYFSKARDGSLVLEEKRSMTHGWFLESTDRENSWHRWERAGE